MREVPSSLIESIGPEGAAALMPHLTRRDVDQGVHIFVDGQPTQSVVFLLSGGMEVSHVSGDKRLVLGSVQPGAWVGEIGFIDKGPSTATVTTTEPSVLLTIDHDTLVQLTRDEPVAASALLQRVTRMLSDRLHKSTSGLVRKLADGRYAIEPAAETQTWLSRTLAWLLGAEEAA